MRPVIPQSKLYNSYNKLEVLRYYAVVGRVNADAMLIHFNDEWYIGNESSPTVRDANQSPNLYIGFSFSVDRYVDHEDLRVPTIVEEIMDLLRRPR